MEGPPAPDYKPVEGGGPNTQRFEAPPEPLLQLTRCDLVRMPLTPGEVVRAETGRWICDKCGRAGAVEDLEGRFDNHGACDYMPLRVMRDLRIRSVTPERERCKTCQGEGCVEGAEPCCERDDCPACGGGGWVPTLEPCTCHGTPGWVDWLVRFEEVE